MEVRSKGGRVVTKNVLTSKNLTTGRPYFERRRVRIPTPETSQPPTIDELPPLDKDGNPILQKTLDEMLNKK